ncbi:MAG TPA: pre-peptidase C-terminal domain-containing protein [Polyangia bacterium]|jgi:V8-like Glu-specific endopeptidase
MSLRIRSLLALGFALSLLPACDYEGQFGEKPKAPATMVPRIINGSTDTTDVAVVALTYQGEQFCSGTLVSPRTVITAGHCLKETGFPVTQVKVFFGNTVGGSGTSVACTAGAAHPSYYTRSDGAPLYDVAYLTLAQDAPVAPTAWQSTALPSLVGQSVQMVGYGVTNAKSQTGNGTRRTVNETITSQDSGFIYYGGGVSGTCQGDSGGPTFALINGVKTLVAVTSYGDNTCVQEGANTRVDTYASFLAPHVTGGGTTPAPTPPPATVKTLTNGTAVTGLSGAAGSWQYFSIAVPAGQTSLAIAMTGGSGDADLYVKLGAQPTASAYDQRPYLNGSNETVTVPNPAAGTYFLGINAYAAYASLSLKATYTAPSGGGGTPAPGAYTETEPNNSRTSANVVSATGTIKGTLGTATDVDYFKVVVPAGETLGMNLAVPADQDYDLRLIDSSGTIIATSQNDLGLAESLTWTNTGSAAATVYVKVYGYSGAYSATAQYQLQLSW